MKNDTLLDQVYLGLANQKRRAMLFELASRPATISYLAKLTGLSLQAIHKHISILEEAKLIVRKKSGRSHFIALNPQSLASAQNWLGQFHTHWGNPQASLENYIQNLPD